MSRRQLHIETFVEPTFGENAYLVSADDEAGQRRGWVIDPSFPPQVDELLEHAREKEIGVEKIILTHGHADHIAGTDAVKAAFPAAAVVIAEPDAGMLGDSNRNLSGPFGLGMTVQSKAEGDLRPGDTLELAGFEWKILDTSGHSPGGRSLYCRTAAVVFTGDALFAGSIGRYDFPGSDGRQLMSNIRSQLLSLPEETVVYSGHGPKTTIGNERKFNPYVSE